jgi:hypothetical protein
MPARPIPATSWWRSTSSASCRSRLSWRRPTAICATCARPSACRGSPRFACPATADANAASSASAAAAVAKLRGLGTREIADALGIAASSAAGLFAFVNGGADIKRLHAGHATREGVQAVLLAAQGVQGPPDGRRAGCSPALPTRRSARGWCRSTMAASRRSFSTSPARSCRPRARRGWAISCGRS